MANEDWLGQMLTYKAGNRLVPGTPFAIDNGRVKLVNGRPVTDPDWCPHRWGTHLDRHMGIDGCLFAVVPDVVCDAEGTDVMWRRWAPAVARRGYRPAYVAQNGCRRIPAGAQVVFLGGDDEFKDGPEGRQVAAAAKADGRWLHVGRVNTKERLHMAARIMRADSVDGTALAHGPDQNLAILRRWLRELEALDAQLNLFGGVA